MASKLARRPFSARRTSPAVAKLARVKAAGLAARRRVSEDRAQDTALMIGTVAAAGYGYLEKSGQTETLRIAGVEPSLVLGVLAGLVAPKFMGRGKGADMLRQVGAQALGIAAYKFGTGSPVIAGDDDLSGGGWPG